MLASVQEQNNDDTISACRGRMKDTVAHDTPPLIPTRRTVERPLFYASVTVVQLRLPTLHLSTDTSVSGAALATTQH